MARQIEDIIVRLKNEGFENLDKIKSSFRELGKVTGFTEVEIARLRKEVLNFDKGAAKNIQTIRGQTEALKALQQQAALGGTAYRKLGADIKSLGAAYKEAATGVKEFTDKQIASQFIGAKSKTFDPQVAALKRQLQDLSVYQRQYADKLTEIQRRELSFNTAVGRQRTIAGFETYRQGGLNLGQALPEMPRTNAALAQSIQEVTDRFANLVRGTREWREAANELKRLSRESANGFDYLSAGAAAAKARLDALRTSLKQVGGGFAEWSRKQTQEQKDRLALERENASRRGIRLAEGPDAIQKSIERNRRRRGLLGAQVSDVPFGPVEPTELFRNIAGIQSQQVTNQLLGRSYTDVAASIRQVSASSDGSLNSLRAQRAAWESLRNALGDNKVALREVDKELAQLDRIIGKRSLGRGRLSGAQFAQAAGAAISGGIFGGPEGFLGGVGGAVIGSAMPGLGTVGGAFAGAAAGAQLGMFRQQLGQVAEYSARIDKLQIALRGIVGNQDAYNQALAAAASVTRDLNVPQETTIQGMTRLTAAVKGAGGTVNDSAFAFRAVSEAVKATGGNAEQTDGALLALTQVFSKGKVSAEELNQIAERLPGTFTLFAKAAGKSGPELQKALQEGEVGLNDLMKFLQLLSSQYGQTALKIAASSQEAGARLTVAFQSMQLEVGRALQPIGASLQSAFADFITTTTPAIISAVKAIATAFTFIAVDPVGKELATLTIQVGLATAGVLLFVPAVKALAVAFAFATTKAKELLVMLVRNPFTLMAVAGTFAAIKIAEIALEQKRLNDEVERSIAIAAKAPSANVAAEINSTSAALRSLRNERTQNENALRAAKAYAGTPFTPEPVLDRTALEIDRLETKLRKLETVYKARIELETIFKGLNPVAGVPTGYKLVNGRLAYLSPGQGYVDAETGKPVSGGLTTFVGGSKEAQEKLGTSYLQAYQQREEAIAQARVQHEEQIADIRKQAVEQARQLERQFADERLALEREIARSKRSTTDIEEDIARQRRILAGEDPRIVEAEQGLADIYRKARDRDIQIKEEYADREFTRARTLSDFQKKTADEINKANESYAKTIGNIQREYAKNVAKIIDEGSEAAGKRLEAAAKIVALYVQRGAFNARLIDATGLAAAEPGRAGQGAIPVGTLLRPEVAAPYRLLAERIQATDRQIQELQGRLQQTAPTPPPAPVLPRTASPYRVGDTIGAGAQRLPVIPAGMGAAQASSAAKDKALAESAKQIELDLITRRNTALNTIKEQVRNLEEQNALLQAQQRYIRDGVTPALAEQYARFDQIGSLLSSQYEEFRLDIQASVQSAKDLAAALEDAQRAARFVQDDRIGLGLREGAEQYIQSIGTMREATAQLAQTGIKGVEDAIFSLATTGTANFREFAASILRDTARMIIQQLILRSVLQIIGAVGGGGGGFSFSGAGPISGASVFSSAQAGFNPLAFSGVKLNALGNAYAANGIVPFAMGGIVTKPTLFKFASGGVPATGLMGEAGPEAIMPLRRGRDGRLGVAGGGDAINITVNVDASGSSVQGNPGQGEALARAVSAAVQAELIKQKRPGGLLP